MLVLTLKIEDFSKWRCDMVCAVNVGMYRIYLCKEGYVFIGISLFVSRIMQKLLDQFSRKPLEMWHINHVRNH